MGRIDEELLAVVGKPIEELVARDEVRFAGDARKLLTLWVVYGEGMAVQLAAHRRNMKFRSLWQAEGRGRGENPLSTWWLEALMADATTTVVTVALSTELDVQQTNQKMSHATTAPLV